MFNAGNDEIALNNFIRNTNLRCAPGHIDLDPLVSRAIASFS